jgi:Tic22-like family
MKSLVRWSAALGFVGTSLLGSFLLPNLPALALPDEQVVQKLQAVPVFTITDPKGAPLVASVPNNKDKDKPPISVAPAFLSQRDAQAFVEKLKKDKPEIGKTVQVVPVSMGEVYKIAKDAQSKPNGLNFQYVPVQQEVQSAQTIVTQGGKQEQQFLGTPLFVATGATDKDYVVFPAQNGQQAIPFFFDKQQLQAIVDTIKQQQPNTKIQIQVVPLESVINKLQTSNDPFVQKIELVRSQEAEQFVQSLPADKPDSQPQAPQQGSSKRPQSTAPQAPRR